MPDDKALADNALDSSSAERMIGELSNHMAQAVTEKYKKALEARKHKDDSVAAGRKYVSAGGHEHAEHTD